MAELSGFEQLTLPLRTPRMSQPHTLCNCAVAWGGDQLRGFAIASGGGQGAAAGLVDIAANLGCLRRPCSNSKKPRELGGAFLPPRQARVVFPAPGVPTRPFQTLSCNCAPVQPLRCLPVAWSYGCMVAAERRGALNPRWARYSVRQRAKRSQITWRRYSLLAPFPKCARRSEAD